MKAIRKKTPKRSAQSSEVGLAEEVLIVMKHDGDTVAIRRGGTYLPGTASDVQGDGSISYAISGSSPQGESGSVEICRTLVRRFNSEGAKWSDPVRPERDEGVDCESCDGKAILKIQVTRADPNLWGPLNELGQVHRKVSPDEAADILRAAIEKKAEKVLNRSDLILALDAGHSAALIFRPVVAAFQRRHGAWARLLDFRAVWLVGPNEELTARLDAPL